MLAGGIGLLRTVPPADPAVLRTLRRAAHALQIPWPDGVAASEVLDSIDRSDPRHVAFVEHAASLLRGAAYTAFDGALPAQTGHAGIGAPYAHVTAPLRRLVDRYASEVCLALHAGSAVPQWVRAALPKLPEVMSAADHRSHEVDRAVVDMTEAWLLQDRVGDMFEAVVIDAGEHAGTIVLDTPAVRARCNGADLPVGEGITARLAVADVATRQVRFERA
jgi:exoribonuclease R